MKRNKSKILIAGILCLAVYTSCKKQLNVLDINSPTTTNYFKTASELQNGVNAAYSTLRSASLAAREWYFLHDMRGGETASGGPQLEAPRAELLQQTNGAPSNFVITMAWNGYYQIINRTNMVISRGPSITDNIALRDQVVNEAKFLRAWAYFELVTQWGEVPLYTAPVVSATDYKGKSPVAEIYGLIIADLTSAAAGLPATASELGRATSGAANTLLGKVLIQKGNEYDAAKTALLKVYGKYTLVDNYSDNFDGDVMVNGQKVTDGHEFNSESIFEIPFMDKGDNNFNWGYNGEGVASGISTIRNQEFGIVWGNIVPSKLYLEEFEANDPRYKFSVYEEGDMMLTYGGTRPGTPFTADNMNVATSTRNGVTKKRIFKKYVILDWDNSGYHPGGINQRVLRYAEVLLLLAECEIELPNGSLSLAKKYIDEVRSRKSVNMPGVSFSSKNQAIRALMHERMVELGIEEVNNIDMLRWRARGYYPSIMADPRAGQQNLLPIPSSETSTNPMIK
ncbi:RagB/SusD family nutrient uptake outer membrane protein [Pedobacter chitinilyticus]|nr:RagB/SusD family nutrient uptake outer membrane protein [Pedobacter chitinilyticus]